jgi:hypothetical protein
MILVSRYCCASVAVECGLAPAAAGSRNLPNTRIGTHGALISLGPDNRVIGPGGFFLCSTVLSLLVKIGKLIGRPAQDDFEIGRASEGSWKNRGAGDSD